MKIQDIKMADFMKKFEESGQDITSIDLVPWSYMTIGEAIEKTELSVEEVSGLIEVLTDKLNNPEVEEVDI